MDHSALERCYCGDPWCKRCFPYHEDEGQSVCNNCGEVIPQDEEECPYCESQDQEQKAPEAQDGAQDQED